MDAKAIYEEACQAAAAAVRANRHLENPNAFDCGFAWVVIQPARGPFVNWLRKQSNEMIAAAGDRRARQQAEGEANHLYGRRRDYGGGGWEFWMPGGREHSGQSIAVFEAGANAMAEVLKRHGIPAQVGSRLD